MQTLQQLQNGQLKGATLLKLSEGLTHFPEEIFNLADTLETLDLSRNKLTALPPHFGRLYKLKILFCSENPFTALPEVLGDCPQLSMVGFKANKIAAVPAKSLNPNLRWLILTDNEIEALPPEIGNCHRLEKLMLAGNQLKELPYELSNCRNLSLLRMAANKLTELPAWLLAMPRLSWLAFSGNLFNKQVTVAPLPFINWQELEIKQLLGEGASGIIFKAERRAEEIAIKVFKGAVTSDGLPEDEMNTCIAAGTHPGLVKLIGQIFNHPENKKGLVMELIPQRFYNLGITPSLDSCTRDVFKEGLSLQPKQIVKIASTIASLAAQLHSKGIIHGDLYAHNTLIDEEGNTLFGDFGAAGFYDKRNEKTAYLLERIEVSAYGYLLDDLLHLYKGVENHPTLIKMGELRDACLIPDVPSRPGFSYLADELAGLS